MGQSARQAIWQAVTIEHSVPAEDRRWWSKRRASCVNMKFVWNDIIHSYDDNIHFVNSTCKLE